MPKAGMLWEHCALYPELLSWQKAFTCSTVCEAVLLGTSKGFPSSHTVLRILSLFEEQEWVGTKVKKYRKSLFP